MFLSITLRPVSNPPSNSQSSVQKDSVPLPRPPDRHRSHREPPTYICRLHLAEVVLGLAMYLSLFPKELQATILNCPRAPAVQPDMTRTANRARHLHKAGRPGRCAPRPLAD